MKNIHILPTDKPSRLHLAFNKTFILSVEFTNENKLYQSIPHNVYITSDEEIKEDYVIAYGVVIKVMIFDKETLYFVNGTKAKREDCKKIILTTDQDLIKDGVQAIDNKFLEWFVKNSSCESVEVETVKFCLEKASISLYQIITPKEIDFKGKDMKQTAVEWLMEQIEWHTGLEYLYEEDYVIKAKEIEKQQQGYSEEDIAIAFDEGQSYSVTGKLIHGKDWIKTHKQEWFEQFKNK